MSHTIRTTKMKCKINVNTGWFLFSQGGKYRTQLHSQQEVCAIHVRNMYTMNALWQFHFEFPLREKVMEAMFYIIQVKYDADILHTALNSEC